MLYQLSYAHHVFGFERSLVSLPRRLLWSEAGGTRTPVHRLRRPMLYPPELLPRTRGNLISPREHDCVKEKCEVVGVGRQVPPRASWCEELDTRRGPSEHACVP